MLYDFDDWRELVSVFFDVEALSPEKAFKAEVEFRRHSQAIASNTRFSAQKFTHQPGSIRGVDHDYLLFERYLSGSGRGLASDIPTAIDPSVLHVVDLSRAYCTITTDVVTNGLLIPHEAVGYDPSRHAAYYSVPVASLKGRVLLAAHEALDEAIAASLPPAEELESAFVSLVGSLLLGDTDERARGERRSHEESRQTRGFAMPDGSRPFGGRTLPQARPVQIQPLSPLRRRRRSHALCRGSSA